MDRCESSGCFEYSRWLVASAAGHFRVCSGCLTSEMQAQGVFCATIIDLKKVLG